MHRNSTMVNLGAAALAVASLGLMAACGPPTGPVVAASDSTPPVASLTVSHTPSGSASSGRLTLLTKSGPLYFSAMGQDPESGIQAVELWVGTGQTSCHLDLCSSEGPGLLGQPRWTSTSPKKNPGEVMVVQSVLIEWDDLQAAIGQGALPPGDSYSKTWEVSARVKNNFGMATWTPTVTATWSEGV